MSRLARDTYAQHGWTGSRPGGRRRQAAGAGHKTQGDTLEKLTDDYGTDAHDEVSRALRKELAHTPLWVLLRHGLKVRGLEFRLYYPPPRSAESAAVAPGAGELGAGGMAGRRRLGTLYVVNG